jgi:coenzyme F420-reducing hydrogenase delta subunit
MKKQPVTLYLFYCSNSLEAEDLKQCCKEFNSNELKRISLPCSGKVNLPYLVKIFETGADGAVVLTCKNGECRFIEGNLRAQKRVQAVDGLLEEIGMGKKRIIVVQPDDQGVEPLIAQLKKFRSNIKRRDG